MAYSAVADGRYESALSRLADAERYTPPTPELQVEISFLRAKSFEGLNQVSDAIGTYKYIISAFPQSPYAFQATERLKLLEVGKHRKQD
jgi:hypothetical protein